ncbi:hypothetical protein L6164_021062 [Bauhinia variegata]|uniref:Uncharacterized protein n=1 Tax=Bauhinia variegata TaxID=167791 RepID=A0ACB9MZ23_BAUVA|nr:hypothetical protein L6164_021062 [Bauhinia variegata]
MKLEKCWHYLIISAVVFSYMYIYLYLYWKSHYLSLTFKTMGYIPKSNALKSSAEMVAFSMTIEHNMDMLISYKLNPFGKSVTIQSEFPQLMLKQQYDSLDFKSSLCHIPKSFT